MPPKSGWKNPMGHSCPDHYRSCEAGENQQIQDRRRVLLQLMGYAPKWIKFSG